MLRPIYHVTAEARIRTLLVGISIPAEFSAIVNGSGFFEGVSTAGKTLQMAAQRKWKDDPKNQVEPVRDLLPDGSSTDG